MRIPFTKEEIRILEQLHDKFRRHSIKWTKDLLQIVPETEGDARECSLARNRYEGIARGYYWAAQDIRNKIKLGKVR